MLQPELKLRRDKIRVLMAQQEIDAALITCNVNLIYTYGRVVSGYLYLSNVLIILKENIYILSVSRNNCPIY